MKKRKKVLIALTVLFALIVTLGGIILWKDQQNPVKDKLKLLDAEKVTGCRVTWINYDSKRYGYTETNPEKVRKLYEALCHMKLEEEKGGSKTGIYYGVALIQDGETYPICAYDSFGQVIVPIEKRYVANIVNWKELDDKYAWGTLFDEMIENAKKEREEQSAEEAKKGS